MTRAETDPASRRRALVVLAITLALAVIAWLFLRRATEAGLDRLALLDRARMQCDSLYAFARHSEDSIRVSMTALTDTIDPRSNDAIRTCGDLGRASK